MNHRIIFTLKEFDPLLPLSGTKPLIFISKPKRETKCGSRATFLLDGRGSEAQKLEFCPGEAQGREFVSDGNRVHIEFLSTEEGSDLWQAGAGSGLVIEYKTGKLITSIKANPLSS